MSQCKKAVASKKTEVIEKAIKVKRVSIKSI